MTGTAPARAAARRALALIGLATGLASLLAAALAVWGGRSGRLDWSFATGVLLNAAAPAMAVAALLAGGAAALLALGSSSSRADLALALLGALAGAGVIAALGVRHAALSHAALVEPPVREVATDWRDPLMPTAALLRLRGPAALRIEAAPSLTEGPRGGFLGRPVAEVNAATCPGAKPLLLPSPPSAAYARLRAATRRPGWRLVTDDPAGGVLEAQAPAPLAYGGRADVLARVRAEGWGSRIDLRSVSRYGAVDGGTNCRRLSALLAALAKGRGGDG